MTAEQEALDAFCRREYRRLVGALSLYCGDPSVAEEVAQEALYRACRRWSQVSQIQAPGAWVHRVAINIANSAYRRRLVLRHHVGCTIVETAELLGISEGAVKQLTHRAVTALRDRVSQTEAPEVPDAR
jgi:DNA-directed RNA polymerase specialized sigma24 family protein